MLCLLYPIKPYILSYVTLRHMSARKKHNSRTAAFRKKKYLKRFKYKYFYIYVD